MPTQVTSLLDLSASSLTRTGVKAANYAAQPNEYVPVDASTGSVTVTLPTAPANKTRVAAKAVLLTAPNTVTVQCGGSDVLNRTGGPTTSVLSVLGHAQVFQYDSASATWTILSVDLPLPQLDTRYLAASVASVTASRTLALSDAAIKLRVNSVSAVTLTVPTNASVAFPVGTVIEIFRLGSGGVTLAAAGGVTINAVGLSVTPRYGSAALHKVGADEWDLVGGLA